MFSRKDAASRLAVNVICYVSRTSRWDGVCKMPGLVYRVWSFKRRPDQTRWKNSGHDGTCSPCHADGRPAGQAGRGGRAATRARACSLQGSKDRIDGACRGKGRGSQGQGPSCPGQVQWVWFNGITSTMEGNMQHGMQNNHHLFILITKS